MKDVNVQMYESKIDPIYTVIIAYNGYERYEEFRSHLTTLNNSIGALLVGTKNIIIDGERVGEDLINEDQLLAIEAHEIAHDKLNHDSGYDVQSEFEADTVGATMLMNLGYNKAAALLAERINQYLDNYYK